MLSWPAVALQYSERVKSHRRDISLDMADTIVHLTDAKAEMQQEAAVFVKNAHKRYGKTQPSVLDGLNMIVPRGCIYGLLGGSGCGKTTLLSCVVGVRKLDQGEIWVLGGRPGQKDSGIPGPRVGYMPQEISLVGEFSVIGALYYFGRINGLEDSVINERYEYFSDVLQLPPKNQLVKNCSGGQQRRVSFAASLMHKPELLILDEPTVGMDPILRERMWEYLVKLTKEEGTAVVITTHYIEECKLANKIGFLRSGQLLAETTPTALLSRFHCQTLEEAFLILSRRQEKCKDAAIADTDVDINEFEEAPIDEKPTLQPEMKCQKQPITSQYGKIFRALIIKNLLQVLRNPSGIALGVILPTIKTLLFFYAVNGDLRGIVMAVVNDEAGHCNYSRNLGEVVYKADKYTCDYRDISCRFLHGFNESVMIKHYFNTIEEATLAVQSGKAAGTMYFGRNFSQALQNRRDLFTDAEEEDIVASEISTSLDMGDSQIGLFLKKYVYDRFFDVHGEILSNCNISKRVADIPIHFEEPVFGRLNQRVSDFMAPPYVLAIAFFLATSVSSSIIIADRAEGVWDRSLVQGVKTSAILFSHMLTQFLMIVVQVTVILIITFGYFQLSSRGSFVLIILMVLLTSINGLCYGFLISVFCNSQTGSYFLAIATFYASLLIGGVAWPVEGMPPFLRYVSYCAPTTVPSLALRGLMDKGHSFMQPEVYNGFFITIGWISMLVGLSLLGLHRKT